MEKNTARILVLIPAYNEETHISAVVQAAAAYLPVLVADDGSRDQTSPLATAAGAQVLLQQPNQGKGAALRAGFRRALQDGYDAVITLDADGQHDPLEIPGFVQTFARTNADLIIGSRNFSQMPLVRRLANAAGNKIISWVWKYPMSDNQSGYRLLSRRMMEACLDSTESSFEFEVEMVALCIRNGWRLEWNPIRTIYAGETSHITPLRHAYHFMRVVLKARP